MGSKSPETEIGVVSRFRRGAENAAMTVGYTLSLAPAVILVTRTFQHGNNQATPIELSADTPDRLVTQTLQQATNYEPSARTWVVFAAAMAIGFGAATLGMLPKFRRVLSEGKNPPAEDI